tara:strand:+ start:48 stop:266 length:219 start_codon:yes stop_codon:yes gene_type:complete
MKVKLIDSKKIIKKMWCFKFKGYDSAIIENLNSGKQVEVDKVPNDAWEYVEEVKQEPLKAKKQNKGKSLKGE